MLFRALTALVALPGTSSPLFCRSRARMQRVSIGGARADGRGMSRLAVALIAFVAGGTAALIVLCVAFRAAPGVIMADDMVNALAAAADRPLRRFPRGGVVYVKSAVGPTLLETLRPRYPFLGLRPYAERPDDDCTESGRPGASCERDDFLKLEVLSAPTHGTLLVAVGTARTFGQVLLVSVFGHWRVLIERWYAV